MSSALEEEGRRGYMHYPGTRPWSRELPTYCRYHRYRKSKAVASCRRAVASQDKPQSLASRISLASYIHYSLELNLKSLGRPTTVTLVLDGIGRYKPLTDRRSLHKR